MFLSPLGERLGEGATDGCVATPSANPSPQGERWHDDDLYLGLSPLMVTRWPCRTFGK